MPQTRQRQATTRQHQTATRHPEMSHADQDGEQFTSGLTSEADWTVQSALFDSRIRTQKLKQKEHQLRGEKAKVEQKKHWADRQETLAKTEEVKAGTALDNHAAAVKDRELNQDAHIQRLAGKSYRIDNKRRQNDGLRQSILNSGSTTTLDHTAGFSAVTGTGDKN